MGPRDLHHNIDVKRVLYPQPAGTTGTGKTGVVIDRQGYRGVEFVLSYGSVTATNATITPTILEGDATGALTSVADIDLLGTEAGAALGQAASRTSGASKNVTKRIGYRGIKRYVTCKLVPTVSAAAIVGANAVLFAPDVAPVAT